MKWSISVLAVSNSKRSSKFKFSSLFTLRFVPWVEYQCCSTFHPLNSHKNSAQLDLYRRRYSQNTEALFSEKQQNQRSRTWIFDYLALGISLYIEYQSCSSRNYLTPVNILSPLDTQNSSYALFSTKSFCATQLMQFISFNLCLKLFISNWNFENVVANVNHSCFRWLDQRGAVLVVLEPEGMAIHHHLHHRASRRF